jgi:hypothetical protein
MATVLFHRQRCLAIPSHSEESNSDTIDSSSAKENCSSTIGIEELSIDLHWESISLQLGERTVRRFSAELSTGMGNQFTADDLSGQRIVSSLIEME